MFISDPFSRVASTGRWFFGFLPFLESTFLFRACGFMAGSEDFFGCAATRADLLTDVVQPGSMAVAAMVLVWQSGSSMEDRLPVVVFFASLLRDIEAENISSSVLTLSLLLSAKAECDTRCRPC